MQGLYRVITEWSGGAGYDHPPVNVNHVQDALLFNDQSQAIANDWAAAVLAMWDAQLKSRYNDIAPTQVTVYSLATDLAPATASTGAAGGTNANESLPAEVSFCCSLHTNLRTRTARGRAYLPAPTNDQSSINAVPVTSMVNAAIAYWEGLRFAADADGHPMQVYSRKLDLATTVQSVTANQTWDTQRKRGLR